MAGKIGQEGNVPKQLWPAVEIWWKDANNPEFKKHMEEMREMQERLRKPLTRREKLKRFFNEVRWRIVVAFDILRRGEGSEHLENDYY